MLLECIALATVILTIISEILPLINVRTNGIIQTIQLKEKAFDNRLLTPETKKILENKEFRDFFNANIKLISELQILLDLQAGIGNESDETQE